MTIVSELPLTSPIVASDRKRSWPWRSWRPERWRSRRRRRTMRRRKSGPSAAKTSLDAARDQRYLTRSGELENAGWGRQRHQAARRTPSVQYRDWLKQARGIHARRVNSAGRDRTRTMDSVRRRSAAGDSPARNRGGQIIMETHATACKRHPQRDGFHKGRRSHRAIIASGGGKPDQPKGSVMIRLSP